MAQRNCQKIKLLKIFEMLRHDTDEAHPLATSQLCKRLGDLGISCDRRTLYQDIAMLNDFGYEIMTKQAGHEKAYYIEDRSFSVPELKIMIDAVQAASFVTEKKTAELTDKIAALGGSHKGEILKGNLVCFNTRKHRNESIYYNVSFLEEAIEQHKKASFFYFDLDETGSRVYRKNKERYLVEPLALVFFEDNYYLMCYNESHEDKRSTYRVDRMDAVEKEDEPISEAAGLAKTTSDIGEYTEQAFKMFGGPLQDVTIQFDRSLINVVYDKFGEDTVMNKVDENTVTADIRVQVSPMFYGWVFQFGRALRILTPDTVIDTIRKQVEEVYMHVE